MSKKVSGVLNSSFLCNLDENGHSFSNFFKVGQLKKKLGNFGLNQCLLLNLLKQFKLYCYFSIPE